MPRLLSLLATTVVLLATLHLAHGAPGEGAMQETATPTWKGKDLQGQAVQVPAPGSVSVLVYIRPGQAQSRAALTAVSQELGKHGAVRVWAIVSGPEAAKRAKAIDEGWKHPVLVDENFAGSGAFDVHAWPTTVVLDAKGRRVGRVPGWPLNFASHLAAYLDFAAGTITAAELERQLTDERVVQDSADQKADRCLGLAERLLASDRHDDALAQLRRAEELAPAAAGVRMHLARVQLLLDQGKQADDLLATLDAATVKAAALNPAELTYLRGWAAMACEQWAQARALLLEALRQGADEGEAAYRLGLVYQHESDPGNAARAFRRAFEATTLGRRLVPATQPSS